MQHQGQSTVSIESGKNKKAHYPDTSISQWNETCDVLVQLGPLISNIEAGKEGSQIMVQVEPRRHHKFYSSVCRHAISISTNNGVS